ncbi:DNA gyrase subunit A [Candidatus Woesebacteria bacterium RBG_16_34_12]|uniref:DNA gyrase subunit A n=1 Tax=Candidatus Woesebacteria bacterium RBG_16_34_12 TaxID=1802480 RepID=A0A1F7X8Y6_9BACT|nr:MAG: DNA gyrase subunit A [Candidatus Woesebacteria bacterium RBG_16_34_12]
MEIGKIKPTSITAELAKSYVDYAMSVIVSRALPDVRDGLKPVHRRILYAMHLMNLGPGASYTKSAKVVGEVLGKYHPHGDIPVYDALVRLAQNFTMRYPLVDGQGNFGSVDGDPPAAMRYTETRLSKITPTMLSDIEKETIDFIDNFDSTLKEPVYLPALLPNLLLMGSEGIAVGMATKIPPHNLAEVTDAVVATIQKGKVTIDEGKQKKETDFVIKKISLVAAGENNLHQDGEIKLPEISFESDITIDELIKIIPGPDFPTGALIYDALSLRDVYSTGRGKITIRGVAEIMEGSRGKQQIIISQIPYQVNKANLILKIANLVKDKKIKGIADLRDESDKDGLRIAIDLKKDAKPKAVLNNLYKHTKLQTTFPANFVALVNGTPCTVNLKQILVEYIRHRQKVILRRTIFDLTAAKRRAHILEGLKIALDNLDAVIKTIRRSQTQEDAKKNLIKKFKLSDIQATAILDMQLRRLAALEREKIEKEYKEIKALIENLIAILKEPKRVLKIIGKEVEDLKTKFDNGRKTKIYKQKVGEFSEEDLVPKEDTIITVTKTGYIKRVPRGIYKSQRRGGKGVLGMTTKEEDEIEHIISATTHDDLLIFSDKGKVYGTKVWEIPVSSRQAKGQALINFLNIEQDEKVLSILPVGTKTSAKNLLMATKKGIVKKTKLSEFENMRASGLIAIKLRNNDCLVTVHQSYGDDHVLLFSKKGKAIKFPEANVRPMGRATTGVTGINLSPGDEIIAMEIFHAKIKKPKDKRKKFFRHILTISENGLGKRTKVDLFPIQKRAGKGVRAAVVNEKTGDLACVTLVTQKVELVVITSKKGQVIKVPLKNIPSMGRATQGVIIMRFAKGSDCVSAVTTLNKNEAQDEIPEG